MSRRQLRALREQDAIAGWLIGRFEKRVRPLTRRARTENPRFVQRRIFFSEFTYFDTDDDDDLFAEPTPVAKTTTKKTKNLFDDSPSEADDFFDVAPKKATSSTEATVKELNHDDDLFGDSPKAKPTDRSKSAKKKKVDLFSSDLFGNDDDLDFLKPVAAKEQQRAGKTRGEVSLTVEEQREYCRLEWNITNVFRSVRVFVWQFSTANLQNFWFTLPVFDWIRSSAVVFRSARRVKIDGDWIDDRPASFRDDWIDSRFRGALHAQVSAEDSRRALFADDEIFHRPNQTSLSSDNVRLPV